MKLDPSKLPFCVEFQKGECGPTDKDKEPAAFAAHVFPAGKPRAYRKRNLPHDTS